jgi:hypothetical protein
MQYRESPMFWGDISPASSGSKSKPSMKLAESGGKQLTAYFSWFHDLLTLPP